MWNIYLYGYGWKERRKSIRRALFNCYNYWVVVRGFVFFFSSRRRHTRSKRDWSSDVCSSDLEEQRRHQRPDGRVDWREHSRHRFAAAAGGAAAGHPPDQQSAHPYRRARSDEGRRKIGRAACRERGEKPGGEETKKQKKIEARR